MRAFATQRKSVSGLLVAVTSACAGLGLPGTALAQAGVLSGVILDETNKLGLQGVQVAVKGTNLVGVTGRDGRFTITGVPAGARQIEAWRAGYRNFSLSVLKIAPDDTARLTVALAAAPAERGVSVAFDEIDFKHQAMDFKLAATEFGIESKELFLDYQPQTFSTGKLSMEVLADGVSPNAPVYVIDGVMLDAAMVVGGRIPTEGIESMEVIKGAAAAALYGQKGMNGVIVMKTKK